MKTQHLLIIAFFITLFGFAQQTYYADVDLTKTGTELQLELADKITRTHISFLSYTPGIWEASKITDLDPNDPTKVILIYGWEDGTDEDITNDRNRDKDNNGGGSGQWNREHTYPRSLGNPNLGSEGPGSDAHHLRPSDIIRNGDRGSRLFADGTGNSGTTAQGHWYPGDEWKGDIARMILYMYLRYGDRCLPSNVAIGEINTLDSKMVDVLLEWNQEDPVSNLEDNRNIYHDSDGEFAQGNRNPFIDNPYLATLIWGGPEAEDRWGISVEDTEAPTIPSNLMVTGSTSNSISLTWTASTDNVSVSKYNIYIDSVLIASSGSNKAVIENLNPSTTYSFMISAVDLKGNESAQSMQIAGMTMAPDTEAPSVPMNLMVSNETSNSIDLSWTAATDNIAVSSYEVYVDEILNTTTSETNISVTQLTAQTTYSFTVVAKDEAGNTSEPSEAVSGTTEELTTGGESTELFFSEYVEGSGFNKALEIANFTNRSIDLSDYRVKRQVNGSGAWENGVALSGTLAVGDVFVIINDDTTDPTLQQEADLFIKNSTPMTFNGNDPVGLFKNDVLIDIIGTFNNSSNFAKDKTLRRKPSVTNPNILFNASEEWDEYSRNTVDNIGQHQLAILDIIEVKQEILEFYPNPSQGQIIIKIGNNNFDNIEIFDLTGKQLWKSKHLSSKTITIKNLPKGFLILRATYGNQTLEEKLIVQ